MRILICLSLLLLSFGSALIAHAGEKPLTLSQAKAKYAAIDAELDKAYATALTELNKKSAAGLREDERAWIAYRDDMVVTPCR